MKAVACALLSGLGFYFSLGLGEQWWLAWLAPAPVLWFAFGSRSGWQAASAAGVAMALGSSSILRAYAQLLPLPVLVLAIAAPALTFAGCVWAARGIYRGRGPVLASVAFPLLWTACDFLASFAGDAGTVGTPAAAEVAVPALIQAASLVGFCGVTFLLGLVPAGLAAAVHSRTAAPAILALALFTANAAYGAWRISQPAAGSIRVALIASDAVIGRVRREDRAATIGAIDAYAAALDERRDPRIALIVLPENLSRVAPAWQNDVQARLAGLADRHAATVVAGFNATRDGLRRNVAWAFTPGSASATAYEKRRLVPGLESGVYTPGPGPTVLANGVGLEICKDMDFQAMLRHDARLTQPRLLAVPAWDFDADAWSHARVAVLRSVENGVPLARAARNGLLTLNDRYGRLVGRARTTDGFTVLVGDLPVDGRGGDTLYDRVGDAFGWLCVALGAVVLGSRPTRAR